jgi:hypothetical protein
MGEEGGVDSVMRDYRGGFDIFPRELCAIGRESPVRGGGNFAPRFVSDPGDVDVLP